MSNSLPTSHANKMYLYGRVYDDQPGEVHLHFSPWKASEGGEHFLIEEFTVERSINWAGVDPTQRQVAQLKVVIEKIRAEAQAQVNEHQKTINNLLAIEGGK